MGSPIHFPQYLLGYLWFAVVLSAALVLSGVELKADKVTESIIVAAVEGEVSSLNMIDDFKVTMGPSSVGRKISAKTILQTGKTGKVSLLFSNGTLVTVKPGSRFYLRKYKQLEAVVENLPKPGELEEEPTKSELSAHLDFGELIVKAPKLKKGSSMKLTSPIGVAGIRGTMFQFMAVRNSVSGDIVGGINLISGDIDFTDTGGKSVTLLSGQSIQLATSKLGEALASKTGELVDLSSTYGPALTEDGALPPPVESLMQSFSAEDDSSGDEESSEDELGSDDTIFTSGPGMSADFIQSLSSEIFFAIEESEIASSDFTFESIQIAPAIEVPVPEIQPPAPPAAVTGETGTGISLNQFVGPPPEIALLGNNGKTWWREISEDGFRMVLEMRSSSDSQTWRYHLDPGIRSSDFLGNDFSENYIRVLNQVLSSFPAPVNSLDYPPFTLNLGQGDTLKETEVPFDETQTNIYELTYLVTDYRGFKSTITRTVETRVTRPFINNIPSLPVTPVPMNDPKGVFADWISSVENTNTVTDVAGNNLPYDQNQSSKNGYFYLDPEPMPILSPGFTQPQKKTTPFQVVAVDWRGVEKRSDFINVTVEAIGPTVTDSTGSTGAKEMTYELSATRLNQLDPDIIARDEFGDLISADNVVLVAISPGQYSVDTRLDSLDQLPEGQTYTFTYEITDSRGVMVEETRNVRIVATSPELSLLDFQSQNQLHGIDPPHPANTIEYTDPWGELLPWLQSIGATGLNDANFTSRITLNGVDYEDFTSTSPELVVGENVLSFTVIDPRYEPGETNSDWLDDLTDDNMVKTITVVKSPPKFVSLADVPPIPMDDPEEDFAQWIADINITDVRGERLLLDQNQSSANGYFYLNQYPELYLGFTEPKQESTPFEIIAVDWRGESSIEASSITVVATGPTISGSSDLTFELSDTPLNQLDPDIIAVDEFGNSISTDNIVLHSISPGDYAVDARLDSLVKLEEGTYTFTYQITDSRRVMVEESRNITIEATTPVWTVADFQSENELYPTNLSHPLNTIEYDDPWEELSPWLQEKVSAQDYNGSDLSERITLELNGDNQPNFTNPQSTPNLEIGGNDLVFKVVDPRFQSGTSETWSDDLTTTYSLSINAVATPPTIDDYQDVIDTIPMDDLNNLFGNQLDQNGSVTEGWLSSVLAKDVRGQLISYNQNKTNNGSGYFYLSPMPDLFTQGVYYFRVYVRDWRDLGEPYETKSELLAVQVKATSPTIEGGEDYVKLEVELSSALINTIDPQITAQDEFNASIEFNGDTEGTIELVTVIGPNSETPEFRIDQLEEGFPYVLDYAVTDFRGVTANVKRYLQVLVTSPTIQTDTIEFTSVYPHGPAKNSDWTIEYTDPAEEYSAWFNGVTAKVHNLETKELINYDYDGENFTKITASSQMDEGYSSPANIESLFNFPGTHDLNFTIVDPRYEEGVTNQDWKDNLTFTSTFTFEVVATLPAIEQGSDLPLEVPMDDDPGRTFLTWLENIVVTDVEGTGIDYDQTASTGARFYLDPMPNLDPGFTIPDAEITEFDIVAIDTRGVERRIADLNVTVRATGATITGGEDLVHELSSEFLNALPYDITAEDEFGASITDIVLSSVTDPDSSVISFTDSTRLDSLPQLSDDGTYTFTYDITDTRGVMVQATRSVSIVVTTPDLTVPAFQSNENLYSGGTHPEGTIEYKDPWEELPDWFSSIIASDLSGDRSSEITLEIDGEEPDDFRSIPPDLGEGDRNFTFKVIDSRYVEGTTHALWLDDLTNRVEKTIKVVKTPPVLEISYDTDRAGLSWDEETSVISYLVKPNRTDYVNPSDSTDNGDDGEFAFTFHSSQQPRKPYYQATAFNGADIPSDQFTVTGVSDGLYDSLSSDPHHPVTISVNDFIQRGTEEANGVSTIKEITVQIVDVLPPYMILKARDGTDGSDENDPIVIHGIASHDNSVNYVFPDPGYEIIDNYYSEVEIQSHNNIVANPDAITFEYPEAPNGISAESITYGGSGGISFMEIPEIFGEVSLSEANVTYELSYQPVVDESNNTSLSNLTRWVRVVDNRIPEVHINGPAEISLNLYNILTGQENYFDYGAYASEDLEADGHVSWMESGWEDDWSVQLEEAEYNSSEFEPYSFEKFAFLTALAAAPSYASTVDSGDLTYEDADARATVLENEPSIENLLALFTEIGPTLAVEIYGAELRFQLTYLLTDKAGNAGTTNAKRIVNFTNAESLVPIILINGSPPDPYEVEVGELEAEPGIVAYLEYSRSPEITPLETLFYLRDNQGQDTQTFPDWDEQKVNYHKASDGTEYYIDENGQWHTDDNATWRKFIVHYRAENPDFPNFSTTKELEIRIQDTTDPYFEVPENIDPQQAGIAFVDVGYSSLSDNYDDAPVVTKIIYEDNLDGTYDELTSPVGTADVFTDLANVGFWSPGTYQIEYTGIDDFNNTYNDDYSINVEDTIAPHIALVSESFLISPTAGLKAEHDTERNFVDVPNDGFHPYFDENSYSVSQWTDLFTSIQSPDGWLDSSFDKINPYVNYGDRTSYLKASEITNLAAVKDGTSSSSEVQIDPFGRSFIWYSAFNLTFDDGSTLQDPGILVVNPSDLEVTVDSEITITETNASDPNSQLLSLKFVYTATQDGGISNEIESNYSKILYFLDEEKPLIILSPEDDGLGRTNASDKFFLIEAGVDLLADTRASEFKLWNDLPNLTPAVAVDGNTSYTLIVSAEDAVDGNLDSEIQRTIIDTDTNQTTAWGSNTIAGISHLNKIYRVEYDVRDGEDTEADEIRNWADTAERYFIVKDTIAPVIDPDRNGTIRTLSATDPDRDLSDINVVKAYMVNDLYQNYVSDEGDIDTDFSGINFDDNATLDWSVTIGKEPNPSTDNFDGAEVYPEQDSEDGGYYVKITVKDDSGNVSAPIARRLKIGDYRPPVIYLNGAAVIHDFFRYGTNTGFDDNVSAPRNQELLFADQPASQEFNSTGLSGGTHRLFLANYNFTDPGAYAEDSDPDVNSSEDQGYFTTADGFPDYNGNNVGEGHAIIRMDDTFSLDADDMETGIIYARSSLESTTFQAIQNQMFLLSNDANLTNPSIVPKVEGNSSFDDNITTQESLNVWLYTIEYRVKDGWENLSDIKTRRVYFYESKQFADSAFYATPLYELNDIDSPFPDRNLSSLSDNQKDYDGDGISDFWEKTLGTKFDDASSFPDSNNDGIPDLKSHSFFSADLNASIPN